MQEGCLGRIVMANSFAAILPVVAIIVAALLPCQSVLPARAFDHERHLPPNTNTIYAVKQCCCFEQYQDLRMKSIEMKEKYEQRLQELGKV